MENMDGMTLTEYLTDYADYLVDVLKEDYGVDLCLASVYIFLTEPNSSKAAHRWNLFLAVFVGLYIVLILVESCDGPNKYVDRSDESKFPFLLTDNEYWAVSIMCWVPLITDATVRLAVLGYIFGHSDNEDIAEELWDDKFTLITMVGDIICIIPFIVRAGYIQPNNIRPGQGTRVILRVVELLSISRILRSTKDIPAIKTIRIALSRAVYHLVLPIFFFFAFNVFASVGVYFSEPCYNTDTCAWVDLFDASFYSVVTMTTTGYGNQVPYYMTTRMISLVIMIFGAIFIALPLAIIGNEYDEAWTDVTEASNLAAAEAREGSATADRTPNRTPDVSGDSVEGSKARSGSKGHFLSGRKSSDPTPAARFDSIAEGPEDEDEKSESDERSAEAMPVVNFNARMTPFTDIDDEEENSGGLSDNYKHISDLWVKLNFEFNDLGAISPTILLNMCELRGWFTSIKWQITSSLKAAMCVKKYVAAAAAAIAATTPAPPATKVLAITKSGGRGRRLSVLGGKQVLPAPSFVTVTEAGGLKSPQKGTGHVELTERAVLSRGDSLFDTSRLRTVSELSDGELAEAAGVTKVEEGSSESTRAAEATAGINSEISDSNNTSTNTNSNSTPLGRRTIRGIGTIFREQLQRVADERMGEGDEQTKQRLPARSLLIMLVKASKDVHPGSAHSTDFTKKMVRAARNPNSFRSRLWMLLELPSSSREARGLRYVLMFLIILSVFVLYTQTLTSLSHYGESTDICGKVLELYCQDKDDPTFDPGCFNQNVDFTQRLAFRNCAYDDADRNCFREGYNFGAHLTNLTCERSNSMGHARPFRSQDQLIQEYGPPTIANSRDESHRIYAVCSRVECSNTIGISEGDDGNKFWIPLEVVINVVFSVEIILRTLVAESYKDFLMDILNVFDVLSIIPFYTELASISTNEGIDFAVLASSPDPLIFVAMKALKVFRLFKITRHFRAAQVLIETAQKVWKQLVGMLAFLMFIITVFAILLFEVEQGEGCYVGDAGCNIPISAMSTVTKGQFIFINKQGDISQFSNALYGLWFSIVTMTSTGYGDVVPSTNAGLIMAVFLMLFGAMYMAMPLTAAASVFYGIHESYNEHKQSRRSKKQNQRKFSGRRSTDSNVANTRKKSRIIGGGRSSATMVSPEPEREPQPPHVQDAKERELHMASQSRFVSDNGVDQAAHQRSELAAKFDARLQRNMETIASQAGDISARIDTFLRSLHHTGEGEAGPEVPVLDQAAAIIEATGACVVLLDNNDLEILDKLSSEFYKLSLVPPPVQQPKRV